MRQLGGVFGSSIVGAVLQNRLSAALKEQAVSRANELPAQLPAAARQRIVDAFASSAQGGLQVGRGQTGGGGATAQLPPNLPASVAHQVQLQVTAYFHDVFVNAYLIAMRPTLLISIALVLLAAISCFGIQRRVVAAAVAEREREPKRGVAATG
jgi:hypothetical protein